MFFICPSMKKHFNVGGNCMVLVRTVDEWRNDLELAIESKVNELYLMGYDKVTAKSIWECLKETKWKNANEKQIYEMVQDIFHLKPGDYMSYLTLNAYIDNTDLESSINALFYSE